MIGRTVSHYRILEKLGEGGMGVVYRALDTRLDRSVAIKVLPPQTVGDPERKWRFVREAKAASALNHPNIVTIYDIDQATFDGKEPADFIAMERVEGESLDRRIERGRLSIEEALDYGAQVASALAAAHAAGIVHRDIKPANIMVTSAGRIKVLDFGLAKLLEPVGEAKESAPTLTSPSYLPPHTRQGIVLGTLAYMSPEQAEGKPVDARSDVFSFGAVLYEMLAGRRPFQGDSHIATITAILRDQPPALRTVRSDVPPELERILRRALAKKPDDRYPSAAEMLGELEECRRHQSAASPVASILGRPAVAASLAALFLLAAGAGIWLWIHSSRVRRAREVEVPEIARLIEKSRSIPAVRLARQAGRYAPAEVDRMRHDWIPASIETIPSGATVSVRDYLGGDSDWENLGRSPLSVRLPLGYYRWRISKEGFEPVETAGVPHRLPAWRLDPIASTPRGMIHVPAGRFELRSVAAVDLSDYWLDKYEVTNRQFKAFVDAGGYEKREYWKQPFVENGLALSLEEAMKRFRDRTGRPGPATWTLGTYAEGQDDYPVGGVSWYEAAAYAEFAGKSLPTIYHWYNAAGADSLFSDILRVSNFGGKGPVPVGTSQGLSPYGNYDMAGNVKEWCWNETGGKRYILGGAWSDPVYLFSESEAQLPLDRSVTNGFRCARYTAPLPAALTRPVEQVSRDYDKEKPVSDDVFQVYRSFYAYDRRPLDARVESVDEKYPYWRKEKVSYRAAYGDERVPAFLFLPRNAVPPFQTVVFFPSSQARIFHSSDQLDMRFLDFVIRSGRAVLFPIYKETYERISPHQQEGPNFRRDMVIAWSKDLGRSLDYLETRPDIDRQRLAYYGLSLGAIDGTVLVALENRFRTAVLLAGGLRFVHVPPEIEPINFAPRVKIPVLLLGGSQDLQHPVETSQNPLFRMLGTPEKDKRHYIFEGGHIASKIEPIIKEILDWLDRYLGPVKTRG